MSIRCRECEATSLPHDEHCTPEELAALRQLRVNDAERRARMRSHGPRVNPDREPDVHP
jgi:hypothetical protein